MRKTEREELIDLRNKIIRLETLIENEFKHISNELQEINISIKKLNDEYGQLLKREASLEVKCNDLQRLFKQSIGHWKLAALVVSPIVTTVIITTIQFIFRFF